MALRPLDPRGTRYDQPYEDEDEEERQRRAVIDQLGTGVDTSRQVDVTPEVQTFQPPTVDTSPGERLGDLPGAGSTPSPVLPGTTPDVTAAPAGRRGWASQTGTGLNLDLPAYGNSGAIWGGFNEDRARAGGDPNSVKDAFFRWTQGLQFSPQGKSKQEIEAAIRENLGSAREYGLNILDVKGDQILIETRERGPEWVDIVGNAGGTGDSPWHWLTQMEFGAPTGAAALGGLGGGLGGSQALDQLGNSDALAQILQQIQALAAGRDPMQDRAILDLLGGAV